MGSMRLELPSDNNAMVRPSILLALLSVLLPQQR
jgi:hypothetical protein